MTVSFPSYPKLLLNGYGVVQAAAVKRTDMDSGPPKQRLDRSRQMVDRTVSYELRTRDDYNAFMAWFRDSIHRGADWFEWPDPETLTTRLARIKGGVLNRQPVNSALTIWRVSFTVESWDE
jgi:hypothetical protein